METITVPSPFKNAMQKVNDFGNSWSGLVAAATLALLAMQLLRKVK